MTEATMLEDLFRYNAWANQRIFSLSAELSDAQLDTPREMGFGSLRSTLFHILAAEEIWLERWEGKPWRPFETQPNGLCLADIQNRLGRVEHARNEMLSRERSAGWQRIVLYKNAKGEEFQNRLSDLALHVANHGTHHRAQALNFLKQFGITVPGGLDYLFFRLAKPHVKQKPAAVDALRTYGLELESGNSPALDWSRDLTQMYFSYSDWANDRLLKLIGTLDSTALDLDLQMGLGTIRKNALHIYDAEHWWLRNWTEGTTMYAHSDKSTAINDLCDAWIPHRMRRNEFLNSLDGPSSRRIVTVQFGGPPLEIPVVESLLQLGGHGTHHRAQLLNMLRRTGLAVPALDIVVWLREH